MHVQYLSVESEKISNHYFTAVGPGSMPPAPQDKHQQFWGPASHPP